MKSNLFVTGLLVVNDGSPFNNNPVTNKLYFTKEKFVHEEIVCFYLMTRKGWIEVPITPVRMNYLFQENNWLIK